jgi:hypothetical protein
MATWKKVIVSGSAAELSQLNVGTNQQITTAQGTTFLTGSFTGSFTGNGAGLTGVTATAIFPTTAKTDLSSTDQFYINDGANKYITYGNLLTDLAGTNLVVESSDSLALAAQIAVTGVTASFTGSLTGALIGTASWATQAVNADTLDNQHGSYYQNASNINAGTLANTYLPQAISVTSVSASVGLTGSLTGALIGTASWATVAATAMSTNAALTAGSGLLSAGTFNGSTARTFSVDSGSMLPYYSGSIFSTLSGGATVSSAGVVTLKTGLVSGSSIASGAQGEVTLTTNGVSAVAVDLGLQTTDSPQFVGLTLTGDAAVNGGDITTSATTFNLVNATATTVNFAGAATTLNLGASTGTTTVNNNLSVKGTLYVEGSVTAISSSNLYVADQFILLASGSATAGDGGIVIDRGSDAAGNIAYGYDSSTDRWGYQSGVADATNVIDPTSASGVSGSFAPYLFVEANHGATKPITGEYAVVGSMYMSNAGDFWIYTA